MSMLLPDAGDQIAILTASAAPPCDRVDGQNARITEQ